MTLNNLSNWKMFLSMFSVRYVLDTQPEMLSKQSDGYETQELRQVENSYYLQ